ncbi:3-isopropylmalate dehydratase small subunit [Nocardia sp. NPDC006044]|uniref:3-isopropylmalate dehydratase small subunit n=1 Tax=Nocardia sp. NPDC006044 TaxID=3364306 RepID=UPI0036C713C3
MEPFIRHTGRAVALRRDNVDTDQIVPAEFCKRVTKSGYADALFARWRDDPEFAPAQARHRDASVLLTGRAFGVGSSREHAVWALRDGGFAVVVATGFGDIFRRNAWNNGLVPVDLPGPVVWELMDEAESATGLTVTVDLGECALLSDKGRWVFPVDQRARQLMLQGLDVVESTLLHRHSIERYERGRPGWLPRIPRGAFEATAEQNDALR